ncbi:4-hydroxy-tetrahydrodipicolinate synthase [Corynebacterium breve]|uniref:4-hydroxy-tetrahydrodipicolinate synthase n=1 Tax=Corynebacterium breve TaxID=3049799 RepID=A0ABY8VCJ1_9CORY|nr:4-hydroxy-tetrahydrodipicolinate synthase [Corynebacterium breve]WIM66817.1 4-hydroxy-tetrahydrodipicolinate synthase [Corynebacterium breve]
MSTPMTAHNGAEYFGRVSVAMVTPFDPSGALDLNAGRKLAAHLVDNGIDSLVLAGTTGESPTTTVEEKIALLKAVKEEVGDRAKLIAGAGTNDTATSVALAQASAEAGADSLLVVTPYYSKPSQEGLVQHYRKVAEATDLPILLYDIPGRSGIPVEADTIRALAEIPTVKGMKDAKGNFNEAAPLIQETGLAWYSGDDPLNVPWLSLGATGFVSVVGHAAPALLRELLTSFEEGDLARTREINASTMHVLAKQQAILGGATFAKAALRLQGIEVGEPRLPVVGVDEAQMETLRQELQKAGVL